MSLKQFWELEYTGNVDKEEHRLSGEEEDAVGQLKEGLNFGGKRFEVPPLWSQAP